MPRPILEIEPSLFETRTVEGQRLFFISVEAELPTGGAEIVVAPLKLGKPPPELVVVTPRITSTDADASALVATTVLAVKGKRIRFVASPVPGDDGEPARALAVRFDILATS